MDRKGIEEEAGKLILRVSKACISQYEGTRTLTSVHSLML